MVTGVSDNCSNCNNNNYNNINNNNRFSTPITRINRNNSYLSATITIIMLLTFTDNSRRAKGDRGSWWKEEEKRR